MKLRTHSHCVWNTCSLQLLSALAYLHQSKGKHRDIQPINVYIDADGGARLAMAGVSKAVAEFVEANDAVIGGDKGEHGM